jgi:hypothetical protein
MTVMGAALRSVGNWRAWVLALLCALAVACADSSSSVEDAGGTDSANTDSASEDAEQRPTSEASEGQAADGADSPEGTGATCEAAANDAGTCNDVVPLGPFVTAACSSAEPPQVTGGTIEDGTYVLNGIVYYGGCMTDISSDTWVICGSQWYAAHHSQLPDSDGAVTPLLRTNVVATVQGTSVNLAVSCDSSLTFAPRGFNASPGSLTFVYPVTNGTIETIYAKK